MIKELLTAAVFLITVYNLLAVDLVKANKPIARIYIAELTDKKKLPSSIRMEKLSTADENQILTSAVYDLNYHLKKISGAELEIVISSDPKEIQMPAIVIGKLATRFGIEPTQKSELKETFRLKTSKGILFISGESPVACAYGIYELLSQLGCDWVMPGEIGEIIPKRNDISISEIDVEQSPSFSLRCPWYSGHRTQQCRDEFDRWKIRHKEQIRKWHPSIMLGGHVWGALVKKYAEQFKKNPEMLALVRKPNGSMERQGPQIETTNPEVLDLFAQYIRDMFKKNKWPDDKKVCIGVGPADGGGFSESVESLIAGAGKVDPISGRPDITDLQVLLCNQLLKNLEPEFPNLHLGFYLYSSHADYPVRYVPDKRLTIVIADITYSRFHGLSDRNSKTRSYYRKVIEKWGRLYHKQGNNIFFRGYNWNLAENFLPYTKLKIWGEDIPYYKDMGVIGFYNECSTAWSVLGPSDYLEAKLTWNVNLDWKEVLKKYCHNAFGKGGPFLEEYYLMLAEQQSKSGQEAGSYHAFSLIYDNDFIKKASLLFDEAEKNSEKTYEKQRVKFARIPLEMLKRYLDFRNAYCSFDFSAAKIKFESMKNELSRYRDINPNLVSQSSIRYLDRFYGKFIEEAAKYSTKKYKIAYRLPDRLKTSFDSNNCGQDMGFFNRDINDKDYITTSTFLSTWDAQGLMGYRSGSAWYRIHFTLPVDQEEKSHGLFIGGTDSIVRVWCNNKYIGEGQGFAKPFVFDLTGLIEKNENLIAIQVQRFGNSEIGVGGLIYPAFIFTGPRLKHRAPKKEKLERLLPGGGN
jgi:hypothetical protein